MGSSKNFLVGGRDRKKQTNKHLYLNIFSVHLYLYELKSPLKLFVKLIINESPTMAQLKEYTTET